MKGNFIIICIMILTFVVFLAFSHTPTLAQYDTGIIMEARAEESDYSLNESQNTGDWYAQVQEDPNEEMNEGFNPYPESEEEDVFRYMPFDINPESENYQEDEEPEDEEAGEEDSMDPESRR